MTKLQTLLVGAAAGVSAISLAASAYAGTTIITPTYNKNGTASTVTGTYTFTKKGSETFKFTINNPYLYSFTITDGGIIGYDYSGTSGTTSVKLTATSPGTVDYTLTTDVPEPAAWALMLVGFGGVGAAMRRRSLKSADAVA